MSHYRLALLGFGNVGRALARLLDRKRQEIEDRYAVTFAVCGIATARHGMALNPGGLDLNAALDLAARGEALTPLSADRPPDAVVDFIRNCGADVLFENTPVDYESGQPAADYIRAALEAGMHAITANKGPVVHAHESLTALAKARGLRFFFESAVMDGAPVFSMFRAALPGARLSAFQGVLNSTTNLILTRMEGGETLDEAVAYAQSVGIAETDPSGDVDGWDAAIKVAALVTVLMGVPLKPAQVDREGIRGISREQLDQALEQGRRWKLVCRAARLEDGVTARVAPEMVAPESSLYGVQGTSSIIQFETDVLGPLTLIEDDPGPDTTAYGLLADFLNAVRD